MSIVRLPGIHPRFEIFGDLDNCKKLWEAVNVNGAPVGATAWSWLDIRAGIPSIGEETSEAFVPQMVNMQLINGVSFKKGCYTGQEIVARMQYLGKLKRRMYLAHIETDSVPAAGDNLYSPDSSSGQGSGNIVNAQVAPDGGYDVLAVVEINSQKKGKVHLGSIKGPLLEFIHLPYEFEKSSD
jgi:folate-binding protein YgfZ